MKIDYVFKDEELLKHALTHSSKSSNNYERLEFLGDSILDFVVGAYLFKNCDKKEGELTVLRSLFVSESNLCKVFDKLELKKDLIVGKSYKGSVSNAVKCDVVEAVIGAIYLDAGLETATYFIEEKLNLKNFKNVKDNNYKSKLQELIQASFKSRMSYKTEKSVEGFKSVFYLDDDAISTGVGKDKISAEQECAKKAINILFKE